MRAVPWPYMGTVFRREWRSSRCNHRLPGPETPSEIVQGTTDVHAQIADALLPQTEPVFDNTTALDAPVDMLDP